MCVFFYDSKLARCESYSLSRTVPSHTRCKQTETWPLDCSARGPRYSLGTDQNINKIGVNLLPAMSLLSSSEGFESSTWWYKNPSTTLAERRSSILVWMRRASKFAVNSHEVNLFSPEPRRMAARSVQCPGRYRLNRRSDTDVGGWTSYGTFLWNIRSVSDFSKASVLGLWNFVPFALLDVWTPDVKCFRNRRIFPQH